MTIKNKYLLLLIFKLFYNSEVLSISLNQIFTEVWIISVLSLKMSGKLLFDTNHRLFKLLVIFFGITNNLVIFQTMMNNIFYNFIVESIIIVYLNNILIFTQTLKEHHRVVSKVLEVLVEHNLYLCIVATTNQGTLSSLISQESHRNYKRT